MASPGRRGSFALDRDLGEAALPVFSPMVVAPDGLTEATYKRGSAVLDKKSVAIGHRTDMFPASYG
jgi:hypothetical protein